MLTDKVKKRRKLSFEILIIFAVCFAISLLLYLFITYFGVGLIEEYCFYNDIYLDEFEAYRLDSTVMGAGLVISMIFFVVLFFALFWDRLVYIRTITDGIDALRMGELTYKVTIMGNNELTDLAEAVNKLAETESTVKEKERRLNEEKEDLIRTLSHDIRTPLTSVMSYTELLEAKESLTDEDMKEYLSLVSKKTAQIKELTDILLEGGRRDVEFFEDARLLFEQLAGELEEALEDDFTLSVILSPFSKFSGSFDVREMRRLFDNLVSNIQKYAESTEAVELLLFQNEGNLVIKQKNMIKKEKRPTESYNMGINSIRRIAHNYGGGVEVFEDGEIFEITVTLSNF